MPELIEKLAESPISMTSHFAGSGLALMIGPWLFMDESRKLAWVHQCLGRLYMLGVLFGGTAGAYMSMHADGGIFAQAGFLTLSLLWLGSAHAAYRLIRQGRVRRHRQMMCINFALTFAAVTLRLYMPVGAISGVAFDAYYVAIAWLCWIPNILLANRVMPKTARDRAIRQYTFQSRG